REVVPEPLGDVGALVVGRAMDVDLVHAVGGLGDAASELARRDLSLTAQHQHRPAQARDDRHLGHQEHDHDDAEQPVLQHDEDDRSQRLPAQEHGLHEGVADEPAQRLDLVLDHGGKLGLLDLTKMRRRKAQDAVVELVAQAPQHALAHAALLGVDALLELTVHDDGGQEDKAHDHQIGQLIDLEAVEQADHLARQDRRKIEFPYQERNGRAVLEGGALDAVVDDRLGHRERQEVENLGEHHQAQDHELLWPAVSPDIREQIALHEIRTAALPLTYPIFDQCVDYI